MDGLRFVYRSMDVRCSDYGVFLYVIEYGFIP